MTPPADLSTLSSSEKDALITALLARVDALVARIEALEAENAALRDKLNQPPKTPDNSSKPPSQGQKANQGSKPRAKRKPHRGHHRALHPSPTREFPVFTEHCSHCQADLEGVRLTTRRRCRRHAARPGCASGGRSRPAGSPLLRRFRCPVRGLREWRRTRCCNRTPWDP
jgi:hypothetical protein